MSLRPANPTEPLGDVVLAVDVGATHFQAGLVTSRGVLIDRARAPIEVDVGPESQYTAVALIVTEMLERAGSRHSVVVRGLGLTSGGHASRGLELVSPLSVPGWRDFPLRARLEELSGHAVHGELDAKGAGARRGWLGAAQGQPNFCAITVSAGVSGGIILDGDLLDGESGYAGQLGHFIVEPGGRRCVCGTQGCLEAEASGQAIDAITGRPVTEPSYQIMQRTGDLVGRTAASICNAFDLSLVVVGGSVALGIRFDVLPCGAGVARRPRSICPTAEALGSLRRDSVSRAHSSGRVRSDGEDSVEPVGAERRVPPGQPPNAR